MNRQFYIKELLKVLNWHYSRENTHYLTDRLKVDGISLVDLVEILRKRFNDQPKLRILIDFVNGLNKSSEALANAINHCSVCDNTKSINVPCLHLTHLESDRFIFMKPSVSVLCPECVGTHMIKRYLEKAKTIYVWELKLQEKTVFFQGMVAELEQEISSYKQKGMTGTLRVRAWMYDYVYKRFLSEPNKYLLDKWEII
jgi:hypothetical protein